MISGVVSKAGTDEIVSDVKSFYGSPLFNSSGNVVGIGRIVEEKSAIRPIAIAAETLAEARKTLAAQRTFTAIAPTAPTDNTPPITCALRDGIAGRRTYIASR